MSFAPEISSLANSSPVGVFKMLVQANREYMQEQINSISNKNESFFITFCKSLYAYEDCNGLLELCESFGYSLKNTVPFTSDHFLKNYANETMVPDYVLLLKKHPNDQVLAEATNKLGVQYIQELDSKGWPLLELAYDYRLHKTIKVLSDMGLDYENRLSKKNLLELAENNAETLDLYWQIKSQKNDDAVMSDEQFQHYKQYLQSEFKKVEHKKKDFRAEQICKDLENRKNMFTVAQKEELIGVVSMCINPGVLKAAIKVLGEKQNSDRVRDLLAPHIDKFGNNEYAYMVLEKNTYWDKHYDGISFIEKLSKLLSKMNLTPTEKSVWGDKTKNAIQATYYRKVNASLPRNLWTQNNEVTGENWFTSIIKSETGIYKFGDFMSIDPSNSDAFTSLTPMRKGQQRYTPDQIDTIQSVLKQTWFKQVDGAPLFEKILQQGVHNLTHIWLFSKENLEVDTYDRVYTVQQKEYMLNQLLEKRVYNKLDNLTDWGKKSTYKSESDFTEALYVNMTKDTEVNWNNIVLSENTLSHLKDSEFLFELKARQFRQQLANELPAATAKRNLNKI